MSATRAVLARKKQHIDSVPFYIFARYNVVRYSSSPVSCQLDSLASLATVKQGPIEFTRTGSRYPVQDTHEPRLKVKDENVGWKHTCSACSHAGFERIGSRSGYNPVQDIYILQRPSSCDPHFRYSEFLFVRRAAIYGFAVLRQLESCNTTLRVRSVISVELCRSDTGWESSSGVRCFGGSICRHVSISNHSYVGQDRSNHDVIVSYVRW